MMGRRASRLSYQNNFRCKSCGWFGDLGELVYFEGSTMLCCPRCSGLSFDESIKPEYADRAEVPREVDGERRPRYENGWRIH